MYEESASAQNFPTKKLGEITVFYAVKSTNSIINIVILGNLNKEERPNGRLSVCLNQKSVHKDSLVFGKTGCMR